MVVRKASTPEQAAMLVLMGGSASHGNGAVSFFQRYGTTGVKPPLPSENLTKASRNIAKRGIEHWESKYLTTMRISVDEQTDSYRTTDLLSTLLVLSVLKNSSI